MTNAPVLIEKEQYRVHGGAAPATLSTAGTVSFAAGLAGVAAGVFLLVTSPKAPARPVAGVGPGRGGLAFAYAF